jgi:hypothetical protein
VTALNAQRVRAGKAVRDTYRLKATGSAKSRLVVETLSLAGCAVKGLASSSAGIVNCSAGETMTVRMMLPARPVVGEVTV